LVGGEVSLDLVNTVSWLGTRREHDWFDPPTNIVRWARAAGLIEERTRRRLERKLGTYGGRLADEATAVVAIRTSLRNALAPFAHGQAPPAAAIRDLNLQLRAAAGRRQLDSGTLRWTWLEPSTLTEAIAPAVLNAAEVLTGVAPGRLRYCPSCDWLFRDTTRNGSRRWCDMADCGSRDKARRYYHRHKTGS
jgi:predicted RNA-binding Zn ribbon-like protein